MEYLRGYRVFRHDPDWLGKIALASLALFSTGFVPLVGQVLVVGWCARILQNAVRGRDAPLPRLDIDFDYLAKVFVLGLKAMVVQFVWMLPIVALWLILTCCLSFLPGLGLLASATDPNQAGTWAVGGILITIVLFGLLFLVTIALIIPATAALVLAEVEGDVMAGLRFARVMAFCRACLKEWVIGSVLLTVVSVGVVLAGCLALCIGIFPATVLVMIAQAHWGAQLYKLWLERGGESSAVDHELDSYDSAVG